ncbi:MULTISPECIES: EamA family transporter RarD [Methylobacterium]|uniref:EamA family transporter RarD n=1 Tax=Methylobacterium TaxID=407 RepID=UPI0008EEB495|nr:MULTISPECIES: EamA family transporter RarD [Methylobacterium]MBZ6412293.1 EamA family transporter RarD [Methylobacterium sp.]MBK3400630.1 EamA family transporter RarD [Methylobacterium ajmalii]MBK3410573.1 EamA family transporter RarD [Methylobacterium ajmalii]MBK3426389.1 EamA family transporter RarD [Methylobacterium ajmalii]SFE72570.1 chloramphenicol-sensitive protein RarD [Methylobacterium sp. yr596]
MGLIYALGAFLSWGLVVPVHFRLLDGVPAWGILAHRILWSSVFVTLLLIGLRAMRRGPVISFQRRHLFLLLSALVVAGNWSLYLWAVQNGRMLDASLGYFINPLVNVALGALVLRESLRPLQLAAVALAAIGVAAAVAAAGALPWISLTLAVSFAIYALIRKLVPIDPILGLGAETFALLPLALAYLALTPPPPGLGSGQWLLLVLTGVTTAVPLMWFAAAASRLKLSTIGLLQYLSPTCLLGLSVFAFGESLPLSRLLVFGLIWAGLALYAFDAARPRPSVVRAPEDSPA